MNKRNFYRKPGFLSKLMVLVLFWLLPADVTAEHARNDLVIGHKNTLEQNIVATLTAELLRYDGLGVVIDNAKETAQIRAALRRGQVDLYWEYTGTALAVFNRFLERLPAGEQFAKLRELDAKLGLYWITPSRVANTYTLVMDKRRADGFGISTMSDLAERLREGWSITFGVSTEFYSRPDGLKPLQTLYDFEIENRQIRLSTSHDELRQWLLNGEIDVMASSRTERWPDDVTVQPIADDLGFFTQYILAPVVRIEVLNAHPEMENRLTALAQSLNNAVILDLSKAAAEDGSDLVQIAQDFLARQGLVERSEDD